MIEALVDSFQFQIQKQSAGYKINNQEIAPKIARINEQLWKVSFQDKSFDIFIFKVDHENQEV